MIEKSPLPSAERLNELLRYDPETGLLIRKVRRGSARAGDVVKFINASGHITLNVDGKPYLAHRVIWKMVTGQDPIDEIDHKDVNGSNNCWENLRESNRPQNMANVPTPSTNTSGVKNVTFRRANKKWHAKIKTNNKDNHIGYFDRLEDAAAAVAEARARLHGDFARAA